MSAMTQMNDETEVEKLRRENEKLKREVNRLKDKERNYLMAEDELLRVRRVRVLTSEASPVLISYIFTYIVLD